MRAILVLSAAYLAWKLYRFRRSPEERPYVPQWVYQHDLSQDVLGEVFAPDPTKLERFIRIARPSWRM